MKKLIVALMFLGFAFPAFSMLVGKVDIQHILLTVKEGQKVRNELKNEFDKKQSEIKSEEEKIKSAKAAYEKQSLVMNAKAKEQKERELQEMIMNLQQKTMGYQREMQAKEQKMMKPILDRIRGIIEEIGKKEKLDIAYEVSAPGVVFAANEKDITPMVIQSYDAKYPGK